MLKYAMIGAALLLASPTFAYEFDLSNPPPAVAYNDSDKGVALAFVYMNHCDANALSKLGFSRLSIAVMQRTAQVHRAQYEFESRVGRGADWTAWCKAAKPFTVELDQQLSR